MGHFSDVCHPIRHVYISRGENLTAVTWNSTMNKRGLDKSTTLLGLMKCAEYCDFKFVSRAKREAECGENIVPDVLSRLWFLRSGVGGDLKYHIVSITVIECVLFVFVYGITTRCTSHRACVGCACMLSQVQFNEISYAGVIRDVAGFNVFFQVNCHMPVQHVYGFLHGLEMRITHEQRRRLGSCCTTRGLFVCRVCVHVVTCTAWGRGP